MTRKQAIEKAIVDYLPDWFEPMAYGIDEDFPLDGVAELAYDLGRLAGLREALGLWVREGVNGLEVAGQKRKRLAKKLGVK